MKNVLRFLTGTGLVLVVVAAASAEAPATEAAPTYVGNAKCRMCHMPEFRAHAAFVQDTTGTVRLKTDTSRAEGVTRPEHVARPDTSMVIGATQTGPIIAHTDRASMTCETCHGPASLHVALPASQRDSAVRRATINRTTATCGSCHEVHPVRR